MHFIDKLKNFQIPETTEIIFPGAFKCSGLKEIYIPSSVKEIRKEAFSPIINLRKIEFSPDGNLLLEDGAFLSNSVKELTIPPSITSIGKHCFCQCSRLETVYYHPSLTYVPEGCFRLSSNLKFVFLSNDIDTIYEDAFSSTGIEEYTNNFSKIKVLYKEAFSYCKDLKNIIVGNNVELGSKVFANCPNVELAYIGTDLIGYKIFGDLKEPALSHAKIYMPKCPGQKEFYPLQTELTKEGAQELFNIVSLKQFSRILKDINISGDELPF